jgi:transcriptional regulator with XRE-family HTH domain
MSEIKPGPVCMVVAQNVRDLRKSRRWSARIVAERCAAAGASGLGRSTIASLETGGRASITVDEVAVLAAVFGVSVPELLGMDVDRGRGAGIRAVDFAVELLNAVRDVVDPPPETDVPARARTARRLMAQLALELDEIDDNTQPTTTNGAS